MGIDRIVDKMVDGTASDALIDRLKEISKKCNLSYESRLKVVVEALFPCSHPLQQKIQILMEFLSAIKLDLYRSY